MRTAPGVPVRPSGEVILTVSGESAAARCTETVASASAQIATLELSRTNRKTRRQGKASKDNDFTKAACRMECKASAEPLPNRRLTNYTRVQSPFSSMK